MTTSMPTGKALRIDHAAVREARRQYGPRNPLPVLLVQQHLAERRLRRAGIGFRSNTNATACDAYRMMDDAIFVSVNLRQAGANWRCIPRSVDGRLPDRPLQVIDLCCGTGDSTAVMASCCPPGSTILGLDISEEFVAHARDRRFPNQDPDQGSEATAVCFKVHSALDPFAWTNGDPVEPASIDWVNASGAVGCHFDEQASAELAANCALVLKPDGLATIDAGKAGTSPDALVRIFAAAGFRCEHVARSNLFDRYRHLCFRRNADQAELAHSA
jgi:SAM-dependent methyltransferase